ncbi:MAG: PadR family transcriptional regulator [Cutibacterium granulosum]|nr:hypothetical protein HMPREF1275_00967 [Propionibacterium sp. KPL1844]MEA5653080.1 PadR family transcriptional regulator [Cutibacterium granulosum]
MSIKFAILALLAERPRHGYQIKSEFDRRTNHSWPLNIGQVYTTLERLERDGLCVRGEENQDGRVIVTITEEGRRAVDEWFGNPVVQDTPPRNEIAIKLAIAASTKGRDVAGIVQAQRRVTVSALQQYRQVRRTIAEDDLAGQLILERMVFDAESEIRWLDHCEAAAVRASHQKRVEAPEESPARETQLAH